MAKKIQKIILSIILLISVFLNIFFLLKYRQVVFEKQEPLLTRDSDFFVYYAFLKKIELVPGTKKVQEDSLKLPDSLVIPPGKYIFYGKTYELNGGGVISICLSPEGKSTKNSI